MTNKFQFQKANFQNNQNGSLSNLNFSIWNLIVI